MRYLLLFMLGVLYGGVMVANEDNAFGIMQAVVAVIATIAVVGWLLWNGLSPLFFS